MSTNVNYSFYNKEGNMLSEHINSPCFSSATYESIDRDSIEIRVWHTLGQVGYSEEEVKRWIKDINLMGFPCKYTGIKIGKVGCWEKKNCYFFSIDLHKYKYKAHLTSTLTLIRYLMEDGIRELPKHYFAIMDMRPKLNKFKVMQLCHVLYVSKTGGYYGINTNHTLRGLHYQTLITKVIVFNRIKETGTMWHEHFGHRYSISALWQGEYLAPILSKDYNDVFKHYKIIK